MQIEDMIFEWDEVKNNKLKHERNVSFEAVVSAIQAYNFIDFMDNSNPVYTHQKIRVVILNNYPHAIPCVFNGNICFLKTIYPDRTLKNIL